MGEALDLVQRGALGPDGPHLVSEDLADWLADRLGHRPKALTLFELALTHASRSEENYERLEFLGDRVLGLVIAAWLYERFPSEPEGKMSRRYNVLVTRETCADVGRASRRFWSTDGNAEWLKPWTWFSALRGSRIGGSYES